MVPLKLVRPFCLPFIAFLIAWLVMASPLLAKEGEKEEPVAEEGEKDGKFTNYGLISISDKHVLLPDRKHVAFKIINNTGRSISNIFGWVYQYEEDDTGKKINFVLVNYPHKSAMCGAGRFHKPGKKVKWIFLLQNRVPEDLQPKYLVLVNMKSIFFARVEMPEPAPSKPSEEEEQTPEQEEKESPVVKKEQPVQ